MFQEEPGDQANGRHDANDGKHLARRCRWTRLSPTDLVRRETWSKAPALSRTEMDPISSD